MSWYGFFLLGIIIGIITGVLIDRDTINKYANKIRKIKIKDSRNISDVIDIKTQIKEARKKKRQIRRENRRKIKSNE